MQIFKLINFNFPSFLGVKESYQDNTQSHKMQQLCFDVVTQ